MARWACVQYIGGMMRRSSFLLLVSCLAVGSFASAAPDDLATREMGRAAFSQPFAFIEGEAAAKFRVGGDLFRLPWFDQSERKAAASAGWALVQPVFLRGCHIGNGRGQTSADEAQVMRSTLVRLSIPGASPHGAPLPEPTYGEQLQRPVCTACLARAKPAFAGMSSPAAARRHVGFAS